MPTRERARTPVESPACQRAVLDTPVVGIAVALRDERGERP